MFNVRVVCEIVDVLNTSKIGTVCSITVQTTDNANVECIEVYVESPTAFY